MFKHILFATDLTPASNALLHCIGPLRTLGAEKATVLHVLNIRDVGGLYINMKKLIEPHIQAQVEDLRREGIEAVSDTALGQPAYEINRFAKERGVSVIVTGTHGESTLKEILLGSVTRNLLQIAQKPVLLIPVYQIAEKGNEARCTALCKALLGNVLFATDFSDSAAHAFSYFRHLAKATGKAVTLYHVQDKARIEAHMKDRLEEFNRVDLERLQRLEKDLLELGAPRVDNVIEYGNPAKLLVEKANSGAYSLLVMGNQGRGYLAEAFLGRVAHYVAHHADIPVLFVPLSL